MKSNEPTSTTPLRLWPGVAAAVLLVLVRLVLPAVMPDGALFGLPLALVGILGAVLFALAIVVWWVFFSRAPWLDRVGAIVLMIVALVAMPPFLDESMAGAGQGMLFYILAIPVQCLVLVAWAVASRRLSGAARRASMAAVILLASGAFSLLRTGGITGDAHSDLHWRWTPTPEERLLAQPVVEPAPAPAAAAAIPEVAPAAPVPAPAIAKIEPSSENAPDTPAEWPGFRGPNRDDVVRGVQLETDWATSPPVEIWRRPIGPGWSSFAVHGDVFFTQEQRGDDEIVAAYKVSTGEPVWRHGDTARFYESNAGPGPRGTPTFHNGRVYAMGATGIVNALDARDGSVVWSRNAAADTGAPLPGWGFAGSPLVVGDALIVAASGRLASYDLATGKPRWFRTTGGGGYSSPHPVTIDGVAQVLLLNGGGVTGVAPADGTVLWEHRWEGAGTSIVQPALTAEGDVLIGSVDSAASGIGTRRLAVARGEGGWTVEERWTTNGLKPSFNDIVVHEGHVYGFDGSILASIDVSDGTRKWKGGRYGHGQFVLFPDQDLLLVLSEEGDLALVSATPDKFTEIARVPAIQGKTWNHPVLVGDVLLVRNGEEMAAFRLTLTRSSH